MNSRKITYAQKQEIGVIIAISMMFFIWIFVFVALSFATLVLFIISALPLLIFSTIKIIVRLINSTIKNEKISKKIFLNTKFEEICIKGIKKSGEVFDKGIKWMGKEMKKTDKINKERMSTKNNKRKCVMCGAQLTSRRKYCSGCRPSGKQKPYWAPKEERLKSYRKNYLNNVRRGWV